MIKECIKCGIYKEEIQFIMGHKKRGNVCRDCKNKRISELKYNRPFSSVEERDQFLKDKEDLTGKVFGFLVVLGKEKRPEYKSRSVLWLCKCKCGKLVSRRAERLYKSTKTSGCRSCCQLEGYGGINMSFYNRIKKNAKARNNIKFDVSIEYIWNLFVKQNRKCALTGIELIFGKTIKNDITTASLDRIDSDIGYIEGNVQWVHKDINWIKNDFPESEFFSWIEKIYNYRIKSKVPPKVKDYPKN